MTWPRPSPGSDCASRAGTVALWPFGRTVTRIDAGAASTVGNVLWFVLIGWSLSLSQLLYGSDLRDMLPVGPSSAQTRA